MLNIRRSAAILNIFKNDLKHIEQFIQHHAPLVAQLVLLDTGSTDGSLKVARQAAERYGNVTVLQEKFEAVDFSAFRNACLRDFCSLRQGGVTHYFWVDTDERLFVGSNEVEAADIYCLERTDVSGRFSTWLQRGFSVAASRTGRWDGRIHEGFYIPEQPPLLKTSELTLQHLESETKRPQEKKLLYFDLVNEQLREYVAAKNWSGARQYASLAMLMASFDFEEPALCAKLYVLHGHLLKEVTTITELNALIHVVRSLSRLGEDAITFGEQVMALHPAKSTVYQVLRGLLLNYKNTYWVKHFYETKYRELPDNIVPEFYNADFSVPEQVALFERRIVRQQHWLDSGYV